MLSFKKFIESYEPVNEAEYNKEWWDSKSDSFKKRYIEKHPNSIYAQKSTSKSPNISTKTPKTKETPFERDRRIKREQDRQAKEKDAIYKTGADANSFSSAKDHAQYGYGLEKKVMEPNRLSKQQKRHYLDLILKDASRYTKRAGWWLTKIDNLDLEDIEMLNNADKELRKRGAPSEIALGLSTNPKLPKHIQKEYLKRCLSGDKLWGLYLNPGIDKEIVNGLVNDKNLTPDYYEPLAKNPAVAKYRPDVLSKLAQQFPREVANNPETPADILRDLAAKNKRKTSVIYAIADHPNAPKDLLIDIYNTHDGDPFVGNFGPYGPAFKQRILDNPNMKKKKK